MALELKISLRYHRNRPKNLKMLKLTYKFKNKLQNSKFALKTINIDIQI